MSVSVPSYQVVEILLNAFRFLVVQNTFQGYTIIYITARPDMQHKVVALWLALHNFPQGLLIFTPSFSTDPLRSVFPLFAASVKVISKFAFQTATVLLGDS